MARRSLPLLLACLALPGFAGAPAGTGQGSKPPISLNGSIPAGGATQSSAYAYGGPASAYGEANEAVAQDPETRGRVEARGYAFHTNRENHAWWAVNLGAGRMLDHAEIENRSDCCQERAATLEVYVSGAPFTSDPATWNRATRVFPVPGGSPAGAFSQQLKVSLVDAKLVSAFEKASTSLLEATIQGDIPAIAKATQELDSLKNQAAKQYVGIRLAGTDNLHLKRVEIFGWK
ncbi:MAG TPA: hypothetical protein VK188_17095 [Holophaga sp.]|nr:hypothetical protein [Holophaga sp.]